jgi:hypothetical protein
MAAWLLPLITGLGSLFGGAAANKAASKTAESNAAYQQGNSELAAYTALQNAKGQQAQDIATRPQQRVGAGALGDLVTQYKTPSVEWGGSGSIPQVSGGFGGLSFSPSTQASAKLMQRDALLRQMQGQQAPDITSVGQIPDVTKNYPKDSWLDKLLGYGALGLGGAETLLGSFKNTASGANSPLAKPKPPQTDANGFNIPQWFR